RQTRGACAAQQTRVSLDPPRARSTQPEQQRRREFAAWKHSRHRLCRRDFDRARGCPGPGDRSTRLAHRRSRSKPALHRDPLSGSFEVVKKLSHRLIRIAILLLTALVLLYGVVYPNFAVVEGSFQRAGTWTLANYREILSQRVVIEAIVSSLGLSIGTVFFCALVGVPLAFLFERFTFPGDASSRRSQRCHWFYRRWSEQSPSSSWPVKVESWPTAYKTSSGFRAHRGVCAAGPRCCSFTLTRCIRFSTCSRA